MQIYISRDGEQNGPYSIEDVNTHLKDGALLPTDLACWEGMTEWVPLSQISGVTIPGDSVETPIPPSQPVPYENKKKILIGIGAGLGLLALIAGIWFFFIREAGLTKEESAKVIEAAIREELYKPTGELTKADLEKVIVLDFDNNQLTDVPQGLEELPQLISLYFSRNKLTDVKRLENFEQLEWLALDENQLTEIPNGLENLTQLKVLDLKNNQLTSVEGLEKLTQLKFLDLRNNKLTNVKGLERLTQLSELWLIKNKLTDVKGLENLKELRKLNLRYNPDLTKAQIDELQKALPECKIDHNAKK